MSCRRVLSASHVVDALPYLYPAAFFSVSLLSSRVSHCLSFFWTFFTAENDGNILFSNAEKTTGADQEGRELAGPINENIVDIPDLVLPGIVN